MGASARPIGTAAGEPADERLFLRAGVGWDEGLVGEARVPSHPGELLVLPARR